jgi:hypothetical protein
MARKHDEIFLCRRPTIWANRPINSRIIESTLESLADGMQGESFESRGMVKVLQSKKCCQPQNFGQSLE